ncbi:MAG: MBL fold metallo-hydrolase, partial [Lachnospiraceae bacterium]|nr:MBL fold metallo-hydrolase [Lachnospiraceae bacterium]
MLNITYLSHSGFLAETKKCYLLFDYYKGTIPSLSEGKPLYVFASHSHKDHFNPNIFELEKMHPQTTYLLSSDISVEEKENRIFIKPEEEKALDGIMIKTLLSTDLGVAFDVEVDGKKLFHAGDLHWWHWIGEPEEENEQMKQAFFSQMDKIKRNHYDAAFLVLDPRQEEAFDWGFDYFLNHIDTDYAFPMHFWKDYSVVDRYRFSEKGKKFKDKVMDICREGQQFV